MAHLLHKGSYVATLETTSSGDMSLSLQVAGYIVVGLFTIVGSIEAISWWVL